MISNSKQDPNNDINNINNINNNNNSSIKECQWSFYWPQQKPIWTATKIKTTTTKKAQNMGCDLIVISLVEYCHTRVHLGNWQVSACKMKPRSGNIFCTNQPDQTRPDQTTYSFSFNVVRCPHPNSPPINKVCAVSPPSKMFSPTLFRYVCISSINSVTHWVTQSFSH